MKRWDIVVIGGGVAGLAAADVLAESGASVVLVEARSRLGERVWTRRGSDAGPPRSSSAPSSCTGAGPR